MADYPICAAVGKRRWRFSPPPSRKIVARKKSQAPLPLPPLFECRRETSTTYGAEVREAGPLEWAFPFRSNAGAESVRPLHACPDCQVCPGDAAMSPAAAERDANGPSMMPTLHCGPLAYSASACPSNVSSSPGIRQCKVLMRTFINDMHFVNHDCLKKA